MADINAQLWQYFVTQLTGSIGGGADPTKFLPTNGLNVADWQQMIVGSAPLPAGVNAGDTIVLNLEAWADAMPVWAAGYQPGSSFYENYRAFLQAIQLTGGDPAFQQIADNLRVKCDTARKQLAADETSAVTGWAAFNSAQASLPPADQTSYSAWYQQNWQSTIGDDQQAFDSVNEDYLQAVQKVGGPDAATLSEALTAVTLHAGSNALNDANGNLQPLYTINPGLNDWYVATLSNSLGSSKPPQVDIKVSVAAAQSAQSQQSSYANSSESGGGGFWFWGGGESSSSSSSQNSQDFSSLVQNLAMEFKADAVTVFTVEPGGWFNSAMIAEFHDQIAPSALSGKPLFGDGGFLNLRTDQIYVAYHRSVTLTGSASDIQQVNSAFQNNSQESFSIGGFFWSGTASSSSGNQGSQALVTTSSDGTSMTIEDTSDWPKVIGIVPLNLQPAASAARSARPDLATPDAEPAILVPAAE